MFAAHLTFYIYIYFFIIISFCIVYNNGFIIFITILVNMFLVSMMSFDDYMPLASLGMLILIIPRLIWIYRNLNNYFSDDEVLLAVREVISIFDKKSVKCILRGRVCQLIIKGEYLYIQENNGDKRTFMIDSLSSQFLIQEFLKVFNKKMDITYDELYSYCLKRMLKVVESASTKALNMQRSKEKKLEELEDTYKIDINIATFEEIKALPGISVILAKKIVSKRDEIGGFNSIDELIEILHVSPNVEQFLRKVVVILPNIKTLPMNCINDEREVDF